MFELKQRIYEKGKRKNKIKIFGKIKLIKKTTKIKKFNNYYFK
jgi:hypothetical protein